MGDLKSYKMRNSSTVITMLVLITVIILYEPILQQIGNANMRLIHFIANLLIVIVAFSTTIQFWFSTNFNRSQREIYLGSNYLFLSLLLLINFLMIDYNITETETNFARIQFVVIMDCLTIMLMPVGMLVAEKSSNRILSERHRNAAAIFPVVAASVVFIVMYTLFYTMKLVLPEQLLLTMKVLTVIKATILHVYVLQMIRAKYDRQTIKVYQTALMYFALYYVAFALYTTVFELLYLLSYLAELLAIFVVFRGIYYLSVRAPYAKLAKRNEEIKRIAYYDEVSGLPNEQHFKKYMQRELERDNRKKMLLIIEMERIEFVRATLGTMVTDEFVKAFVARLRKVAGHHYIVRIMDDQIAICVPYEDEGELQQWCERLIAMMDVAFSVKKYTLQLSINIGVACYPVHHTKRNMLRRYANQALIEAHRKKKRYKIFEETWNSRSVEELTIENDLIQALQRKEIYMLYQPQFDVRKGCITGVEALIRWEHPERGFISPEQFIPILERSGLIAEVGEYVLRQACEDAQKWEERYGWPLKVGVNLSLAQLLVQDYPQIVKQVLHDTGVIAADLKIEITESMALDVQQVFPVLQELRELGVQIAIDDFGTGYSSLAYLHEYPVDILKIDRSFVESIGENERAEKVIAGIIALAKELELEIIAEGIECETQFHYLAQNDCDYIQGYLVSRPVTMQELILRAGEMNTVIGEMLERRADD